MGLAEHDRLGRFEILGPVGAGGMGEVYRALDRELKREVAIKVLPAEVATDAERVRRFETEARAAAALNHPNILAVHDVGTYEGAPYLVTELLEGETLRERIRAGGLTVAKAVEYAVPVAEGLAVAHAKGIIHRDLKTDNLFLTTDGRIKILDFGLAKLTEPEVGEGQSLTESVATQSGAVMGTAGYMAPELVRGVAADARSDIFSFGVVLYEMLCGRRPFFGATIGETMSKILNEDPPALGPPVPTALQRIVSRCLEKLPADRFSSAHDLALALEALQELPAKPAPPVVPDEPRPYPGLAAFTEADAEYFFGREAEVEELWRKIPEHRLLGIIGPSGAGKSSFIRAGVVPKKPTGWGIVVCTPGNAAITSFGQALASEIAGDPDAVRRLLSFDDPDVAVEVVVGWRQRWSEALIVVDQFEELFTQNTTEEQARFAGLLGRLVADADVRIVLCMRDDFLMRCQEQDAFRPVFESLTPLLPPAGEALRSALVDPAARCGFAFEDDALVNEMLGEVEGERGALPLLAFAVSRLWEKRDRQKKSLTRQAYLAIGGVGGALAKHAEATLEATGQERLPIVRELFRNLVTAEGTRAVRDWTELLSIFPAADVGVGLPGRYAGRTPARDGRIGVDRSVRGHKAPGYVLKGSRNEAGEVLRALVDARLLTSYEIHGDDEESQRRVEIIHESLLANWPRLVRWRTQDADGAQLRDQLRQAARTWDERQRRDDLLWTGTAFREYQVWRERYPGGLTEVEEAFARAMTSLATRRRRRLRFGVAAGFAVLLAGLAIVGSFWQRSVAEARRAEAQKLLALGQLDLEADPTAALAWARASLDLFDTHEGRIFALRALAEGSIARVLPMGVTGKYAVFSPDGEWMAVQGFERFEVHHRSGGPAVFEDGIPTRGGGTVWPFFDASSSRLTVVGMGESRSYEVPGFSEIARRQISDPTQRELAWVTTTNRGTIFVSSVDGTVEIERWQSDSSPELLLKTQDMLYGDIDASGQWAAGLRYGDRRRHVYLRSLVDQTLPPRRIHTHNEPIADFTLHPDLEWIAVRGQDSQEISLWPIDAEATEPIRTFDSRGPFNLNLGVFPEGPQVVAAGSLDGNPAALVWDLRLPPGADPSFLRTQGGIVHQISGDPDGRWLLVCAGVVVFWPLPERPTLVFSSGAGLVYELAFTSDGEALVVPRFNGGGLRIQPIVGDGPSRLLQANRRLTMVDMDPLGRFAVVGSGSEVAVYPLDGSEPTVVGGFGDSAAAGPVAYDPERELVAGGVVRGPPDQKVIHVWSLRDGSMQVLGPADDAGDVFVGGYWELEFLPDGSLLSFSQGGGVRRWRLEDGSSELLFDGSCQGMDVTADGRTVVTMCDGPVIKILDLTANEVRVVEGFQGGISAGALSPAGDLIAAGYSDGEVRIRRLSGGDPHILFGHDAQVNALTFSPDGRRLATVDRSGTIRVWHVPDMSKPPLHTLPLNELLAKLDTFTNVRMVRDEQSSTGWTGELGPFPGWETVPEW